MFKTLAATMLAASALFSVTTAGSASAAGCQQIANVEQVGYGNKLKINQTGCSAFHFGVRHSDHLGSLGHRQGNRVASPKAGASVRPVRSGPVFTADVHGRHNKVAGHQSSRGAVARVHVAGEANAVFIRQK